MLYGVDLDAFGRPDHELVATMWHTKKLRHSCGDVADYLSVSNGSPVFPDATWKRRRNAGEDMATLNIADCKCAGLSVALYCAPCRSSRPLKLGPIRGKLAAEPLLTLFNRRAFKCGCGAQAAGMAVLRDEDGEAVRIGGWGRGFEDVPLRQIEL